MINDELKEYIKREIAQAAQIPVGAIFAFPSEKIPEGFLPCEGQELSKMQYPELFQLIGTTFGGTAITFCLPDLQGQFIRGLDRDGNIDYDENGNIRAVGSFQKHSFQGHSHMADTSVLEISSGGSHDHDLYWSEFKVRDYSINDFNNHEQCFAMPFADKDDHQYFGRTSASAFTKDGTTVDGTHTHSVVMKENSNFIGYPISSSFGSVENNISSETRPRNVALIFCIKAR